LVLTDLVLSNDWTRWWLAVLLLPVGVAGRWFITAALRSDEYESAKRRYDKDNLLSPDRIVRHADLDRQSRDLTDRAARARRIVLTSGVYADNLLDKTAGEIELRQHEWEIACDLRHITELRAAHDQVREQHAQMRIDSQLGQHPAGEDSGRAAEAMGPEIARVLSPQHRILTAALESAESRVSAMENYARQVKAADAARLDWESASKLSDLNPAFLNLAARIASDDQARRDLANLSDQAAAAALVFQESIARANLAAEALVLPDDVDHQASNPQERTDPAPDAT